MTLKNMKTRTGYACPFIMHMKGEFDLKKEVLPILGIVGAYISNIFGGWDAALTTLVIFMGIDYITGLVVAAVFKNSPKTESGALESRVGLKGLLRKGMMLLVVLVAVRLDILTGTSFLKDATVIAFVVNETLSILENAGLMGVKYPDLIKNALDVLQKKSQGSENK